MAPGSAQRKSVQAPIYERRACAAVCLWLCACSGEGLWTEGEGRHESRVRRSCLLWTLPLLRLVSWRISRRCWPRCCVPLSARSCLSLGFARCVLRQPPPRCPAPPRWPVSWLRRIGPAWSRRPVALRQRRAALRGSGFTSAKNKVHRHNLQYQPPPRPAPRPFTTHLSPHPL